MALVALWVGINKDDLLATFVPIAVYWMCCGVYMVFEKLQLHENYRLHSKEEEEANNTISKRSVLKGVLLQHVIQIFISILVLTRQPSLQVIFLQFFVAMVAMDTWQYFAHRMMHASRFLYKHVHSKHHALVAPYAFGAHYSHPAEGLIIDTGSAIFAFFVSGMTPRTCMFFLSFATVKAIDDHSSLRLPGNLFHCFFHHNGAFHDVHHQPYGFKYNFSNPFFVSWDKLMGTYMSYTVQKRHNGRGLIVKPINKKMSQ
ncbi:Sphinganine C(4)-monooxygenase 1 [Platanthera zijinensis]|uniref:aldehyde oxygenase (deformylating) n=1 Tax=Platanthera zijinensis TaxID=2320716 RepID=A0AAP0GBZ9_9ASPA